MKSLDKHQYTCSRTGFGANRAANPSCMQICQDAAYFLDNLLEGMVSHSVPAGAVGDRVDGAGQHDAALVAVCRTLLVLHDLSNKHQNTLLTSHMLNTKPFPKSP